MATQRSGLALGALALSAFVIGTAELVVVGILNLVAADMGVSISSAGWIVTTYALGISLGGPVVSAVTTRFGRRSLLLVALAAYVGGNLLVALATSFGLVLLARVLTGSIHGLFIGVASVVAANLVPAERRGQAISTVFGGIAAATVFGVPIGTLVGQTFGWRAAFFGIVAVGALALVATLAVVPDVGGHGGGLGEQARAAFAPRVLLTLAVGLLLLGGQFTAFTYLAVYLEQVTGVSGGLVSAYLLIYGVASAVGIGIGGRLADLGPGATMLGCNVLLVLTLGALFLFGGSPVLAAVLLAVWGAVGFGLVPSFQLRTISLAGSGGDLAAALGASAVNAGIAAGAVIGGWALDAFGPAGIVLAAVVICTVALPVNWVAGRLPAPVERAGVADPAAAR